MSESPDTRSLVSASSQANLMEIDAVSFVLLLLSDQLVLPMLFICRIETVRRVIELFSVLVSSPRRCWPNRSSFN